MRSQQSRGDGDGEGSDDGNFNDTLSYTRSSIPNSVVVDIEERPSQSDQSYFQHPLQSHYIEMNSEPVRITVIPNLNDAVPIEINGIHPIDSSSDSNNMSNYSEVVNRARAAFETGKTKSLSFRETQLKALKKMYIDNKSLFCEALASDLRKSKLESLVFEVEFLINDLIHTLNNFKSWAEPEKPPKGFVNMLDELLIYKEPFGVVLIMGAWNYPVQLTLLPFTAAVATGNCAIIKPSELSPASASLMAKLIPQYLDNECYHVACGGVKETTVLLENRFDYIFFTGSTTVGRIVHAAANKHLTPVTLELGGKSPTYIDSTADIEMSVKRVLWGKCINAGQTCVAPDYVLCNKEVQEKFVATAKKILKEWYGENPQDSLDLCRIINDRNFQRVIQFLKSGNGTIAVGGRNDPKDRFVEPTILVNVPPNAPVMQDEIFAPILPIVNVNNAYEAIKYINEREKPLALYIFSKNDKDVQLILNNTTSGGVTINDTIMHIAVDALPFGGVGYSGMGSYHGKQSFDTFTHKKGCLRKNFMTLGEKLTSARYPPYTNGKISFLTNMMSPKPGLPSKFLCHLLVFGLGALTMYAGLYASKYLHKMSDDNN